MSGIVLTQSSTPIIGQVAWLLGQLMNGIFIVLDTIFSIENIGLSIIVFTIVIYTLMIPLTYKQQKFQKLSSVMNPEIQKIQKKYKGKKDQQSMLKMQEETKLVYEKYGTNPTGGCLQLLIQMPILFGLYQVIQNIPAYVTSMKDAYIPLADKILASPNHIKILEEIGSEAPIYLSPDKVNYGQVNTVIDVLYKFQSETWQTLVDKAPELGQLAETTQEAVSHFNSFLGINIANSPLSIIRDNWETNLWIAVVALLIPLLSGLSQYLSIRISQSSQPAMDQDNPMASSMKMMNTVMPLMSVWMCFSFASGLGIYWIISAVVRTVQQVAISKYLDHKDLDTMIKANRDKAAAKREKKGISADKLNEMAQKNAKKIETIKEQQEKQQKQQEKQSLSNKTNINKKNESSKPVNNNVSKPGSLASKANLVKQYNEGNK